MGLPQARFLLLHAVLAGFVFSLHHSVADFINRGDYTPFGVSENASVITLDETHYAATATRFAALHRFVAETDVYEHRSLHANIPYLPTAILGTLALALGSIERAFMVSDFLFPAALLVLFYNLTSGWVESRMSRMFIAWSMLAVPWGPQDFFWLGYDSRLDQPWVTRNPHPELSLIFLLISVLLLARVLSSAFNWKRAFGTGILSAAPVYCYYFYGFAWAVTLGMVLALGMIWRDRTFALSALFVCAGALLSSLPYVLILWQARREGGQAFLLERMGSHSLAIYPFWLTLGVVGLTILIVFGRRLSRTDESQIRYLVLTTLLVVSMLAANSQLLLGVNPQNGHFLYRLATPFLFYLTAVTLFHLLEKQRSWHTIQKALPYAFILLVCNVAARQYVVGVRTAAFQKQTNPEMALVLWIRSHIPAEKVVGTTAPRLIALIPALTAEYSYAPTGNRSLTSTAEMVERYYQLARSVGFSEAELARVVRQPGKFHPSELMLMFGLGPRRIGEFIDGYKTFQGNPDDGLTYRIDYVILPASAAVPETLVRRYPKLQRVYQNSGFQLLVLQ